MALTAAEIAARLGYAAAFFYSSSELKALLNRAVKGKWTAEKFQASFMATKWYKTHAGPVREWIALEKSDPATAAARKSAQLAKFTNLASQLGLSIDSKTMSKLARDSLMFSWNDDQLKVTLSTYFKYSDEGLKGQASTMQTQIRNMAHDYGVSLSEKQLGDLIKGNIAGRYGEDHIQDLIRDQARSKYPGLEDDLKKGFTVRQVAAPYLSSYAQLLEVDEDTIDLNDRSVQAALQGAPSAPGKPPARQSVLDFERTIRKDPRWAKTKNARDSAVNSTLQVLSDWGLF